MDVLLLPANGASAAPGALYAEEATQACVELCGWLTDLGQPIRLAAWLPDTTTERTAQAALVARLRELGGYSVLVFAGRRALAHEPLGDTALAYANEAVLVDDGAPTVQAARERAAVREPLAALREAGHPAVWRLWAACGNGAGGLEVLRQYAPVQGLLTQREQPLFSVGGAQHAPDMDLPAIFKSEPIPCALFEAVVTLTGDAEVVACPRHAQDARGHLGALTSLSPRALFVAKGQCLPRIGNLPGCITCDAVGRFYWLASRIPEIEALMNRAAQGNVPEAEPETPPPAPPATGETVDLSEASEDAQAQALADFEARLDAWSASLEALDGTDEEGPERG